MSGYGGAGRGRRVARPLTQLREDACVRRLEREPLLEQRGQLLPVAAALVHGDELLQVVGRHDDVQPRGLRELELAHADARRGHLLPHLDGVGLLGGVL